MNLISLRGRWGPTSRHGDRSERRFRIPGRVGWPALGATVGLLIWLGAMPFFMGDPRILHGVIPASAEAPPVLVARSSFAMLADSRSMSNAVPEGSGLLPKTNALEEMYRPVRVAMNIPKVAEALGLPDLRIAALTPPLPLAAAVDGTSPFEPPAPEPEFSDPAAVPPGGKPVASMATVVNPTDQPLLGSLRPTVMLGDAGLCRALKMAAVSMRAGAEPVVLLAGDLAQTMRDPATPLLLEPGESYDLAILLALPPDIPNEFQGLSCTVNFLMDFAEGS